MQGSLMSLNPLESYRIEVRRENRQERRGDV